MSEMAVPEFTLFRRGALAGRDLATDVSGVSVEDATPCARFVLRGGGAAALAVGLLLNLDIPRAAYGSAREDAGRAVLWLGPDEWLILAPEEKGGEMKDKLTAKLKELAHALVDVSHRDTGLIVRGPGAADAINAGCPLDLHLSAFPIGACTRTLLGKAEIVLWRVAADTFRIDMGRSFAPYVVALLQQAARDGD